MKKVYLIAVVFALIAGFATYYFATYIDSKTTIKDADTKDVIVALCDIPENTKITEDMFGDESVYFTTKTVIVDNLVPNYVENSEDLIDMITVDQIYAGEQINLARFESVDGEDVALSFKLDEGRVAYSFSAGSVTSVDGYISEGDTVDVIISYQDEDGETKTEVAYSDLKVLRVSTNSANSSASSSGSSITEYSTLTVDVTEEQALELYNIEKTYSFKLVLNARGNEELETTQATTENED